jgi:hypothetical protein
LEERFAARDRDAKHIEKVIVDDEEVGVSGGASVAAEAEDGPAADRDDRRAQLLTLQEFLDVLPACLARYKDEPRLADGTAPLARPIQALLGYVVSSLGFGIVICLSVVRNQTCSWASHTVPKRVFFFSPLRL